MFKRIAIWAAIFAQPLSACCYACCPCPEKAARNAHKPCCEKRPVVEAPKRCCCVPAVKSAASKHNPSTCCDELRQSADRCAAERERVRHLVAPAAPCALADQVSPVWWTESAASTPEIRYCFDSNNLRQAYLGVWLK